MTQRVRRVGVDEGRLMRGGSHQLKAGVADTGGALTVWVSSTACGKGPPLHVHEREDELFYVLAGRYEMVCGAERALVGAGCFLFLPRRTPHTFRCTSSEIQGRLLQCAVPGGFEDYFEAVADSEAGTEKGSRLRRIAGERYGLRFPDDPRQLLPGAEREPAYRIRPENGAEIDGMPTLTVRRFGFEESAGRVAVEELHVAPGASWELVADGRRAVAFLREGEVELDGATLVAGETLILSSGARCAGSSSGGRRARWTIVSTPP